jgi:hypothetical protein
MTDTNTDLFFRDVVMTPARMACREAFEAYDEGLGARGMKVLLQMGDNDPRLRPNDVEWMADGVEKPELAVSDGDGWRLTDMGQRLYDLIDRGEWIEVIRLTTDPTFGRETN